MLKVCGVEVSEQTILTILQSSTACYQSLTTENNILLLDYVNIGEFNIPTILLIYSQPGVCLCAHSL